MKSKFMQKQYIQYYPEDVFCTDMFYRYYLPRYRKEIPTKTVFEGDFDFILNKGDFFRIENGESFKIEYVFVTEGKDVEYWLSENIVDDKESYEVAKQLGEEYKLKQKEKEESMRLTNHTKNKKKLGIRERVKVWFCE